MNGIMKENAGRFEFDDVDKIYNHASYIAFSNNSRKVFRKPQYTFLKQITGLFIHSANSLTLTREQWCNILGCVDHNNLTRKLKGLSGDICKVETSRSNPDITTGSVRVTVSPAYYFVGTKRERELAILDWYVERGMELIEKGTDWYLSEDYQQSLKQY